MYKGILRKTNGFCDFNALRSRFSHTQWSWPWVSAGKGLDFFEWVLTSSRESRNPSSSGNCCFSSGEEFSSTKNKLKLAKQCGRQASKIKTKRFEIFLKWRHSSPVFHYAVSFIGRGHSGKFEAWFYGKKHQNSLFWGWRHFYML